MRISVQWLREWVDVGEDIEALSRALTMAGLEVEGNEPAAEAMSGVIVAEVLNVERHPDAEKLNVCRVATGKETVQVVCGAPNVRVGMKAPLAQVGATLPGGVSIKKAKLRGVDSFGMLCSARELGLSEDASGLLDLPADFVVGTDLVAALALDDRILEINLTPNRGDCLSVAGVARETAAVTGRTMHAPRFEPVAKQGEAVFPVNIEAPEACPRFAGRVIRGLRANQSAPLWMRERLRRAGIRSINLLVDVTNYVVLELGQPMHAYDLNKIKGSVVVRMARTGESITLLDGRAVDLSNDILVIADNETVLGMAGVMGGEASGISEATVDIFLEAAHFTPDAIIGRGRRYGLITDASQRFERGVDPALPSVAIERATRLILEYAGGQPGPTITTASPDPTAKPIALRYDRLNKVLGLKVPAAEVDGHLRKLGMAVKSLDGRLAVTPPSWRFDVKIEEDLIEEVARLHGYNNIPPLEAATVERLARSTESVVRPDRVADLLSDRGYQEVITYSFLDPAWQRLMFKEGQPRALMNPLSAELGVMRLSLWPSLAHAARENVRRQQSRVRIFELGHKFVDGEEVETIAGLALGSALEDQWDSAARKVDFFDVKADVEAILSVTDDSEAFAFKADQHVALHPGQTARIFRGSTAVGWIGALHPEVVKRMDLTYGIYVFELETKPTLAARLPQFAEISRFPAVRRDLAVIVDESIEFDRLAAQVRASAGMLLRDLSVLSVYRGEQIEKGKKSIALSLNLQDTSRTLTDEDADRVIAQVIEHLRMQLGASIRDK